MKRLPAIILCVLLLTPGAALAHDFNQADVSAMQAMGYHAWAVAHNQAAPADPVAPCIPDKFYDGRLPIGWFCTPAEQAVMDAAAASAAQSSAAADRTHECIQMASAMAKAGSIAIDFLAACLSGSPMPAGSAVSQPPSPLGAPPPVIASGTTTVMNPNGSMGPTYTTSGTTTTTMNPDGSMGPTYTRSGNTISTLNPDGSMGPTYSGY